MHWAELVSEPFSDLHLIANIDISGTSQLKNSAHNIVHKSVDELSATGKNFDAYSKGHSYHFSHTLTHNDTQDLDCFQCRSKFIIWNDPVDAINAMSGSDSARPAILWFEAESVSISARFPGIFGGIRPRSGTRQLASLPRNSGTHASISFLNKRLPNHSPQHGPHRWLVSRL